MMLTQKIRFILGLLARAFVRQFYWRLLSASKLFRGWIFDSAPENILLLSNVGNERLLVPSNDRAISRDVFITGSCEFHKFDRVLSLLDKQFRKTLLVDVGANIGIICIPAIKRNIFQCAIAIEPEPLNYSLLVANININGLANKIIPHNLALGSKVGDELVLELSEVNYGDHRIKVSDSNGLFDEAERKSIRVKAEPFDVVVGDVDSSQTLIWMDTQGFEAFVLMGAKKALEKQTPLVIEFWPYAMNRNGSYPLLKQAIIQAGYKVFYDLGSDAFPRRISFEAFDNLFRTLGESENVYTDLLIC